MMHQPGDAVRDDEPSRSDRGGSVVFGGSPFRRMAWEDHLRSGRGVMQPMRDAAAAYATYAQFCMTEDELRCELGMTPDLDENEELIRSTRAEFDPARDPLPVQPFGAGDAMRWSPPPEGVEVPPCPA